MYKYTEPKQMYLFSTKRDFDFDRKINVGLFLGDPRLQEMRITAIIAVLPNLFLVVAY